MEDYLVVNAGDIGEMIRFHRKKSGLSQLALSRLANVGKTVVFDIEKGKLSVRLDSLLKIMHILNIKLDFQSPLMESFKEKLNEKSAHLRQ